MTQGRSSDCLERELLSLELPGGPKLYVLMFCVRWPGEHGYNMLSGEGKLIAAAVRSDVVASRRHAALAAALAYYMRVQGRGIARKGGIDIVLVLTGERNIAKALSKARPKEGAEALVLAAAEDLQELKKLEEVFREVPRARCCFDPLRALRKGGGEPKCVSRAPDECAEALLITRSSALAAFRK